VLVTGLVILTAGIAWLSRIPLHGSYLADVLGPSLLFAVGLGLGFVALSIASTAGVEDNDAGLAGALISATQQIGAAIGLAVVASVVASYTHTAHGPAAINDGFQAALMVAAGIAAAGVLIAATVLPGRTRPQPATAACPCPPENPPQPSTLNAQPSTLTPRSPRKASP
jgi:MFS family permease